MKQVKEMCEVRETTPRKTGTSLDEIVREFRDKAERLKKMKRNDSGINELGEELREFNVYSELFEFLYDTKIMSYVPYIVDVKNIRQR